MVRAGFQLSEAPFLRLLFPLCMGVSLEHCAMQVLPMLLIGLLFAFLAILIYFRNHSFYFQPYWGGALFVVILFFGFIRSSSEKNYFPILPTQRYFVIIDEYPQEKEKSFQLTGQFINSKSRILVYLPKSTNALQAIPGDVLCFTALPELVENEGNPFEFDYKRYLNNKMIGYRIFLREHQYCLLKSSDQLNLFRRAQQFRAKLISILARSGMDVANVPLVSSIAFGARNDVDKETIQKFTNTGVIHVLAVSGMNVGLVFIILDFFFRFLRSGRVGNLIYTGIVLVGIWSYALITGMSASILRAATMFSFIILGRALHRNSNIFNTLAASAFLLVVWKPSMLYDIGFQLSYAAVLSIVVIQPILYKKLYFKSWIVDKMWLMLSVTFAAQLGTLPFTLQYFHQFPVYFWLANLAVIPMVTLILYLSFVVLLLSLLSGFITSLFAFVLDWSVRVVLISVNMVDNLPNSVIKGLNPNLSQIILLSVAVILLYQYARCRKFLLLQGALVSILVLTFTVVIGNYRKLAREEIVFFNIQGARVLALTSGKESMVFYDKGVKQPEKLNYYLKSYLGARGINRTELVRLTDSLRLKSRNVSIIGSLFFFKGVSLYLQPPNAKSINKERGIIPADLIWLSDKINDRDGFDFPLTKILLFRGTAEDAEYIQSHFPQQSIQVNKAVKLTIKADLKGNNTILSLGYFDDAYSINIPLPCRIISASPVVQSTMVDGLLSP